MIRLPNNYNVNLLVVEICECVGNNSIYTESKTPSYYYFFTIWLTILNLTIQQKYRFNFKMCKKKKKKKKKNTNTNTKCINYNEK